MSTTDMTWRRKAACRTQTDLFTHPALDYNAADPEFADLTPAEHTARAAEKAAVEAAAVDFCFGCPVMQQCDEWALATGEAFGVAGGRTEDERAALLDARGATVSVTTDPTLTATLRDRGPRLQVDDAAVERLTALGRDSKYIAHELGCAERTVVRARARIAARKAAQTAEKATQILTAATTQPTGTTVDPAVAEIDRQITALGAALTRPRTTTGSQISPAMAAIYTALGDGQWHPREALLTVGVAHISDTDALDWWTRANSIDGGDGSKVLNPAKATTPLDERITIGAREKVSNMLSASCRTRKNTERGGPTGNDRDLYRLTTKAIESGLGSTAVAAAPAPKRARRTVAA